MTRRASFWIALPLTVIAVVLWTLVVIFTFLGIWGSDPDLVDKYIASAFACAFIGIAAGGGAGFAWREYSR